MLYKTLDISKQAVHQHKASSDRRMEEQSYVSVIVEQVRADHPTMGVRDIYYMMRPEGIGRDRFEEICRKLKLSSVRMGNPIRTTDSSGVSRFDNLLEGLSVTEVNQVWQSDITYFEVGGKFFYITFITDAFSRMIVGYSVSSRLFTEDTVIPALENAVLFRGGVLPDGLIFHSDGGGQYYSKKFLEMTRKLHFRNSMCLYSWENGKAERVNGVIKNNYLAHRVINTYNELCREVDRSVSLYNNEKPHIKLHRMSPLQFEKSVSLQRPNPISQRALDSGAEATSQKLNEHENIINNKRQVVNHI